MGLQLTCLSPNDCQLPSNTKLRASTVGPPASNKHHQTVQALEKVRVAVEAGTGARAAKLTKDEAFSIK